MPCWKDLQHLNGQGVECPGHALLSGFRLVSIGGGRCAGSGDDFEFEAECDSRVAGFDGESCDAASTTASRSAGEKVSGLAGHRPECAAGAAM